MPIISDLAVVYRGAPLLPAGGLFFLSFLPGGNPLEPLLETSNSVNMPLYTRLVGDALVIQNYLV